MNRIKKSQSASSRSRIARAVRQVNFSRTVVLDQVGLVRNRNGKGVLRLKLIGPVDRLRRLRMVEGERLEIDRHNLSGEHAA